jgi:hypothetical protein
MNINYEIKETDDYGKCIYALENVSSGTLIWSYKLNVNVFEYTEEQLKVILPNLPSLAAQQQFLDYAFGKGDVLCLITDDGVYMNHADASNCNCRTDLNSGNCFAVRDIKAGEQLFEDYATFSHPPFLFELLKKYDCEPTYYTINKCG